MEIGVNVELPAILAQSVEIRNQQVEGSSPLDGSSKERLGTKCQAFFGFVVAGGEGNPGAGGKQNFIDSAFIFNSIFS